MKKDDKRFRPKKGARVKWYDVGAWRTGTVYGRSVSERLAYVVPDDPRTINGEPVVELVAWDDLSPAGSDGGRAEANG